MSLFPRAVRPAPYTALIIFESNTHIQMLVHNTRPRGVNSGSFTQQTTLFIPGIIITIGGQVSSHAVRKRQWWIEETHD